MILLGQKNALKRATKDLDLFQNEVKLHNVSFEHSALFSGAPPGTKISLDG